MNDDEVGRLSKLLEDASEIVAFLQEHGVPVARGSGLMSVAAILGPIRLATSQLSADIASAKSNGFNVRRDVLKWAREALGELKLSPETEEAHKELEELVRSFEASTEWITKRE